MMISIIAFQTYYTVIRYNQFMRDYLQTPVVLRLLLVVILIFALNLAAQPHQVSQAWSRIQSAINSPTFNQAENRQISRQMLTLARLMPWRNDLWRAAGIYALWAGDWKSGLDSLERVNFTGLNADQWASVGDAYLQAGQPDQAEYAWDRSTALAEDIKVSMRIYNLHRQKGDFQAVLDDLQTLNSLAPDNSEIAYQYAVHLAVEDLQKVLDWRKQAPEFQEPYQSKIDLLVRKLLSATLVDSPATQFLISGQGLAELNEWDLAQLAFQKAIQLEPDYPEAWAFLGEAMQHLQPPQTESALEYLQYALSLDPTSISSLSMFALYWQRQGDYSRAVDLYLQAANLEPQNPAWLAALGSLAGIQGNLQEAEAYYLAAVELAPNQADYYILLADFYIQNQIQIREKALPAAQSALKIDPLNPKTLTTLAQVDLLLDEDRKAIQLLQTALQNDPEYSKAHFLLGMAYVFRNQPDLAYAHLSVASQSSQDPTIQEQALRAIRYYFP